MSAVSAVPTSSAFLPPFAVMRMLANVLPDARLVDGEISLELTTQTSQPARLISAAIIEGTDLRARRVFDPPTVGFAAFLDGTQKSQVVTYRGGVPLVLGTVAGVIRDRRNQRLYTWEHRVEQRLYAPKAQIDPSAWQ